MNGDISISDWQTARLLRAARRRIEQIDDQIRITFPGPERDELVTAKKETEEVMRYCHNFPPLKPLQEILDPLNSDAEHWQKAKTAITGQKGKFDADWDQTLARTSDRLEEYLSLPQRILDIVRWDELQHTTKVSAAEIQRALSKPKTSSPGTLTRWARAFVYYFSGGRLFNKPNQ